MCEHQRLESAVYCKTSHLPSFLMQHIRDDRETIPNLKTKRGKIPNEHIIYIKAIDDRPERAHEVISDFQASLTSAQDKVESNDVHGMLRLSLKAAQITKPKSEHLLHANAYPLS